MNFEHLNYLPFIIIAFVVFVGFTIWLERKFFNIVRLYWFYKRSLFSYASSFLFLLGIGFLLFSLLDLRGPEEKIKAGVPTERTIILIDTSASMLAEDIKPSRLQKAVLIAKHFARKAAGHQMAIVVFAEIQKKIVPFTNDLDLIDSRLESIKSLRNQNGSSALSSAIQESVQYFKETGDARGNILILTDGEETAEDIELKIPKDIHVALVGVGTTQGGRIPLDDSRGFRFGYKKSKGEDVITKLNETFFKKLASDLPSAEYWLANSYSLPSDEILDFFKTEVKKGDQEQDLVIKPVLMEWVVVPAMLLLIASYFVKAIRMFSLGLFLLILPLHAQEEEPPKELKPEVSRKLEQLRLGELSRLEKLKLADDLYKGGAKDQALALYGENLPSGNVDPKLPPEAYLNYGTALLEKGDAKKGLELYQSLNSAVDAKSPQGAKILDMMEKNIAKFFTVQEQKKEQQKKEDKEKKENKDNKDNKDEKENKDQKQGSGEGQDKKDQKGSSKPDPKDQKNPKGDQKKIEEGKDAQDENEKNDKDDKAKDAESKPEDQAEKKKLPPQKLPSKLKQLMSDDRQLQLKMIEQGTREMNQRKNRQTKDW